MKVTNMINTNINSLLLQGKNGSMGVRIMDKTIHHDRKRMLYTTEIKNSH